MLKLLLLYPAQCSSWRRQYGLLRPVCHMKQILKMVEKMD
jgi:hypothetical protein